jgi:hypothetical protein
VNSLGKNVWTLNICYDVMPSNRRFHPVDEILLF